MRQDAAWLSEGLIHSPQRTGATGFESENASRTGAQRVLQQLQLAEERLAQFAHGERCALRIAMECHTCYEWLLKMVRPYLQQSPDVDVDVDVDMRQKFQFGGIGALQGFEIDLLPPTIRCSNQGCSLRKCLAMNKFW